MWEKEFFESWANVGRALVWTLWENQNLKKKTKKTKIIEFLIFLIFLIFCYRNNYHFLNIIIIIIIMFNLIIILSFLFSYCPRQSCSGGSCDELQHIISIKKTRNHIQ